MAGVEHALTDSPICATLRGARAEGLGHDAVEQCVWARHGTTCAMLALDSAGMARLTRSHGIVHFLAAYVAMRDLAAGVLARHGSIGARCFADNVFAEFPDVPPAVAAAREIHAELHRSGLEVGNDEPYRVCLAISYGRVLANGGLGVMGDEMNIVAKLAEDVAEPGDTLVTSAAFARLDPRDQANARCVHAVISKLPITYYQLQP